MHDLLATLSNPALTNVIPAAAGGYPFIEITAGSTFLSLLLVLSTFTKAGPTPTVVIDRTTPALLRVFAIGGIWIVLVPLGIDGYLDATAGVVALTGAVTVPLLAVLLPMVVNDIVQPPNTSAS